MIDFLINTPSHKRWVMRHYLGQWVEVQMGIDSRKRGYIIQLNAPFVSADGGDYRTTVHQHLVQFADGTARRFPPSVLKSI